MWRQTTGTRKSKTKPDAKALNAIEKQEKEKIQKTVVALIPIPDIPDPLKEVTVETYFDYASDVGSER